MDPGSSVDDEFTDLMARVRKRSPEACDELVRIYEKHVVRAIRRHLHTQMRIQHDSIDFLQTVWACFFAKSTWPDFEEPAQLIAYLVAIARNKVFDECRKRNTLRYNAKMEQHVSDTSLGEEASLPGKSPTPSAIYSAKEQVEALKDEIEVEYRDVIQLRANGLTYVEIAAITGHSVRSIRRAMRRLESRTKK